MTTKRYTWIQVEMRVNPHIPRLNVSRNTIRALNVFTPNRRAETHLGVVGLLNGIFLGAKCEEGDNGAL